MVIKNMYFSQIYTDLLMVNYMHRAAHGSSPRTDLLMRNRAPSHLTLSERQYKLYQLIK